MYLCGCFLLMYGRSYPLLGKFKKTTEKDKVKNKQCPLNKFDMDGGGKELIKYIIPGGQSYLIPFYGGVLFHCAYIAHLSYPFKC